MSPTRHDSKCSMEQWVKIAKWFRLSQKLHGLFSLKVEKAIQYKQQLSSMWTVAKIRNAPDIG